MNKKESNNTRPVVAAVFAAVITATVSQNGRGPFVSAAAGILGGTAYYLVSRFVINP